MPTTSHDRTAPSNICLLQPIHQQHTGSNNLFAILKDYALENDDNRIADDITIQSSNQTSGTTLNPSLQQVSKPKKCINTQTVLTSLHTSTVHDLRPTPTPTLLLQPWVLQSSQQQPFANPTMIELQ
jgi:hypothetical protein